MKKVLVLTTDLEKHGRLKDLFPNGEIKVSVHLYSDLAFFIDGVNSSVTLFSTGEDIKEFSKVIVLLTPAHSENFIFSALACYCRKNNIPMFDDEYTNTSSKLYALWRFWENDIPVAKTAFGPIEFMCQKLNELGETCIVKSTHGTKGRDSYLIHNEAELRDALSHEGHYVLQNYVENDGDWRIIVINYEPKLAIYRSSHGRDYRNNTSLGGDAKLTPLSEVDPKVLELASKATRAVNIKIAGADVIMDKNTGECSVLEINRTPQLVTGSYLDEKTAVLREFIES